MPTATRRVLAVALTGCLAAAACSSDTNPPAEAADEPTATTTAPAVETSSPGCDAEAVVEPGTTDRTMTSGGADRSYQLVIPEGYDGTTPMPVVFGLHALTVDYRIVPTMSGFDDMAPTYDFIGVSPSGLLDGTVPYWMAAKTDPPSRDLTYISELLDLLEAELCIDPSRVFSVGMSNGAQMSSLLACQLDDRITAVAPLAGVEWPKTCDGDPVPVIAFHGDEDPFVNYEGGGLDAARISDMHAWKGDVPDGVPIHEGVEAAMANWAAHNGCDPEPIVEDISDEVVRTTWQDCDADTVLYRIIGGGHTWPGRPQPGFEQTFGYTTMDIDATQLMFEFFFNAEPSS